jgi:hypothetical protein
VTAYWDSSSRIAALMDGHELEGVTRPHTLAEVFSTLTGKGIDTLDGRQRLLPDDVAAILFDLPKLVFVELTAAETLKAVQEAGPQGGRGGLLHDWLHVQAEEKAGADVILTENTRPFRTLTKTRPETSAPFVAR